MKCPKCGKEIDCVNVYTEVKQRCIIEGYKIVMYGEEDKLDFPSGIECPECKEDITGYIEF